MDHVDVAPSTPIDVNAETVSHLVRVVNEAYNRGERGMWKGESVRTNDEEMRSFLLDSKILLARCISGEIVGCVFVNTSFREGLGELGMLCVSETYLGKGLGTVLISAAEQHCRQFGCKKVQLELLTPRDYVHPVKAWLQGWYQRLGYVKGMPEDFGTAYPRMQPLLACECVFTAYVKQLS